VTSSGMIEMQQHVVNALMTHLWLFQTYSMIQQTWNRSYFVLRSNMRLQNNMLLTAWLLQQVICCYGCQRIIPSWIPLVSTLWFVSVSINYVYVYLWKLLMYVILNFCYYLYVHLYKNVHMELIALRYTQCIICQ
jgi:hypothetical protein